ncbi:MAG: amidohydrolase family protein [Candidatus Cryptobacteroides sp.]
MSDIRRITASYIYTLDDESPLRNSFVEYDSVDGRIVRIGECGEGEQVPDVAIVPGFVNSHCHCELSHLHGKFRKGTGMAGFIDQINALRDWAGNDVKEMLVRKWMDKMWEDGVSAMADISNDESSFAVKAGHRMYTRTFLEVFGTEPEQCAQVMSDVALLQEKARSAGIDAAPTPHSCYTMSPELLVAASVEGMKSGFLSYHSQESREEEDFIRYGSGALHENRKRESMSTPAPTGGSSLEYFIGRLAGAMPAPYDANVLLVHNVCLSQEDIDIAKQTFNNLFFAVCPLSNIFIHNALPPIELMRRNGLAITVGTDSLSSNDDLDILAEIRCLHENFPEVGMGEIFGWACLNGARFLGKEEELGSLVPGKRPGIVMIDGIDSEGCVTADSRSRRII